MMYRLDDDVRSYHAEIQVEIACHLTKRSRIECRRSTYRQVLAGEVSRFLVDGVPLQSF
jgi:hypothetical protein